MYDFFLFDELHANWNANMINKYIKTLNSFFIQPTDLKANDNRHLNLTIISNIHCK